ncbi:MAG: YaiI/YqxD family protein [Ruminococcaceae bacterium]|nr:YaiI/YqxD family protein [Oscillospiraceae bacterium]
MTVWIDADACPVTKEAVRLAKKYGVAVKCVCDCHHVLSSDYAEIITVGAGKDAADLWIANHCERGDVVITQDYGAATLALSRGASAIHQSGAVYTKENIDALLFYRYEAQKQRRAAGKTHLKGPKKRTAEEDRAFCEAFEKLLREREQ